MDREENGDSDSSLLTAYPWPPEDPSSLVRLDLLHDFSHGNTSSLFDVSEELGAALRRSGYLEQSYYGAPGGFVLVTRLEGIDEHGAPLVDERRYLPPDDRSNFSFADYIRHLFFAPEGFYRFIAFVVTDRPYRTSAEVLTEDAALSRLRRGAVALPPSFDELSFSERHRVDALIYEFRKHAELIETLRPGRLPPATHLEKSGLSSALERTGG
jgi:hypothetical protein